MKTRWNSGERLEQALACYSNCNLCEHRCRVNRASMPGFCKAGTSAQVFRHRVEYGEEAELIPCHLFYLSGCDLRCGFCIAGLNAFDPRRGTELTSEFFNRTVAWGKQRGARTLQWVGGEPTIHLPRILEVMAKCPGLPPVVWKSDFHGTPEAFDLLEGAVDWYVADFKFGNDACARRLAGVDEYVRIVTRNLRRVANQGRLIVRHLLLPGHEECCFARIARWLAAEMPEVAFSLRDSYLPKWRADRFSEIAHPLPAEDSARAYDLAGRLGLTVIA